MKRIIKLVDYPVYPKDYDTSRISNRIRPLGFTDLIFLLSDGLAVEIDSDVLEEKEHSFNGCKVFKSEIDGRDYWFSVDINNILLNKSGSREPVAIIPIEDGDEVALLALQSIFPSFFEDEESEE